MKRFYITGFQWGHLFVENFWRLLIWSLFYTLSPNRDNERAMVLYNGSHETILGVGGAYPNDALWAKGWNVSLCGRIGRAFILQYLPPNVPIPDSWIPTGKENMPSTQTAEERPTTD